MSTKPQKILDPRREEMVYGKTFSGVVKMNKYLRPKTGSDIKEATLGKGTFGSVTLVVAFHPLFSLTSGIATS
jgi:hypothetical protein